MVCSVVPRKILFLRTYWVFWRIYTLAELVNSTISKFQKGERGRRVNITKNNRNHSFEHVGIKKPMCVYIASRFISGLSRGTRWTQGHSGNRTRKVKSLHLWNESFTQGQIQTGFFKIVCRIFWTVFVNIPTIPWDAEPEN